MISLILYAVLAAGVVFGAISAWHGIQHTISAPFVAAQIAHDQQIVDAANKRADEEHARAEHAQADTQVCTEAVKTQSDLVSLWQSRAQENFKAAAKARADAQAAHVASQTAVQRYVEIVNRPPVKDQTCQQKLDATDKLLRDAARARAAAKAGK